MPQESCVQSAVELRQTASTAARRTIPFGGSGESWAATRRNGHLRFYFPPADRSRGHVNRKRRIRGKPDMMNAGQTTDRVYEALRQRITMHELRPGARIDPGKVAAEFDSSVTPVRDALHILAGEGLVEVRHGEGFFLPHVDEPGLMDLYDWNLDLILAALRRSEPQPGIFPRLDGDPAAQTAALFGTIARSSGNKVHAVAVRWTNARLNPARRVEADGLFEVAEELTAIAEAISTGDRASARKLITVYHAHRKRMAKKIVEALYGDSDTVADL